MEEVRRTAPLMGEASEDNDSSRTPCTLPPHTHSSRRPHPHREQGRVHATARKVHTQAKGS